MRLEVDKESKQVLHMQLLRGVVDRTSFVCFIWSIAIIFWGLASLDIFRVVKPDMTVAENVIPRIFFNAIPALIVALWYLNSDKNTVIKAYSTAITLPMLLVAAALVNAWPLIWRGHYDLYLYMHAANLITISTALALSSGAPRIIISQAVGFFVFFWLPILVMLLRKEDNLILVKLILNDYGLVLVVFIPGLFAVHKLRYKLALADKQVKEMTKSFLGSPLTKAIYEGGVEALANFTQSGIILAVDMRGYTNFVHNTDAKISKEFMRKYHALVAQAVGRHEGYMHKSSGDGHIISFGVMDAPPDIGDLPGYEGELKRSSEMQRAAYFLNALKTFMEMLMGFEKLKADCHVELPLLIGAGLAHGPIEIVLRGDKRYKQELDIDGETIVRAVRLESYSKYLNSNVDSDSSFLIISPELGSEIEGVPGVHAWATKGEGHIRDYPWIEKVFFRQWKHNRSRAQAPQAA